MSVDEQALAMRRAFDRSFAEPRRELGAPDVPLLSIRVGGERYAVRSHEVARLVRDHVPTPLPGAPAHLLGIVGIAADLLAVYDLAGLLGHPHTGTPRWLLVVAGGALGLAFDGFEGQLRCAPQAIVAMPEGTATRHVDALLRTDTATLPILHIHTLVEGVRASVTRAAPLQEQ